MSSLCKEVGSNIGIHGICNYMYIIYLCMECNNVNLEIFVYENIYVLNGRVNKFSWMIHKNILMPIPSKG